MLNGTVSLLLMRLFLKALVFPVHVSARGCLRPGRCVHRNLNCALLVSADTGVENTVAAETALQCSSTMSDTCALCLSKRLMPKGVIEKKKKPYGVLLATGKLVTIDFFSSKLTVYFFCSGRLARR